MDVDIRLEEAPINNVAPVVAQRPELAAERLGIRVQALDPDVAQRAGFEDATGVILTEVARGSVAERRGVAQYRGFKLMRIDDTEITAPEDVRHALDDVASGEIVSLHFQDRAGDSRVVNIRMP
jgi:S1-C subfamily serine protease